MLVYCMGISFAHQMLLKNLHPPMRTLLMAFLFCNQLCLAQVFSETQYPQGYFRNPLNVPISLSGNFGELRPNHYHMGLDLRTLKRENLPVYAAAEGYIAKVKIEPGGFGRAIYINHPNGFTTLYAHLNNFFPALETYIKQQQYKLESWKLFLDLPPDLFPVKKGDFIAYSGNTGGSQAPHLHFEIRRTNDDVNVNPLLFRLPLADNVRPRIYRLALYDRTKSMYEQAPRIYPVKLTGFNYITMPGLIQVPSSKISFAITATDSHSGSTNPNGIFESLLYVNDAPVVGFRMDNISYDNTRYLNAHIDYRRRAVGGPYLQHLSELPGHLRSIYKKQQGNGVIDIGDGEVHVINIEVKDTYGNKTILQTKVQYIQSVVNNLQPVNGKLFHPLMLDGFETDDCEFYIGENCLYDSVHVMYSQTVSTNPQAVSAVHAIGASYIPLHEPYLIRIRPNRGLQTHELQRTVMQWYAGAKKDVQKVEWLNNWAAARFRDFGYYQLIVDEEPPQIVPIGFANGSNLSKANRIAFTIKDNLNKFKNVRTEIDGNWICFTNDKGRTFSYRFDEKCPRGEHELKIIAEDEAGNVSEKLFRFVR